MNDAPVTIIMSAFNELRDIDRSLDAVLEQEHCAEVVVVDGGSTDGTAQRLLDRAAREPRLRVHADGMRRSLPAALNVALEICRTPFAAKVDARTFIAPDFLARSLDVFDREGEKVACVGGRPEQFGETRFGEGFARARTSPFGVGGSGYADSRPYADVDTVQCGVYRCSALAGVGGFDPDLQFGEDEEANWRLREAGYRIVRDTRIRFRYVTRPTWKGAFRQYRNYGRARVKVWRKHREFIRLHHLIPSIAVVAGAGLAAVAALVPEARGVALLAAAGYAGVALAAAVHASRGSKSTVPYTVAAFTALHLGYGVGMLEGLAAAPAPPDTTLRTQTR